MMNQSNISELFRLKSYLTLGAWIFIISTAGVFIATDAFGYIEFNENNYGRFWNYRWSLVGHITGGVLALALGPFQFWKAFRNRYLSAHRWMGRIYLTAILVGSVSATYLAWTAGLAIHWTWAFSLQCLALAWIITASMAYISVLRMRIQQHQQWMIRSYVVTFAFVIFRWLDNLPFMEQLGEFHEHGPTAIWVSWTIPLLITEIVISWNKK